MDEPTNGLERESESLSARLKDALIGPARDLRDPTALHKISLIPFLAWVGLGADGLSSSAYGPEEAYRALGEHTYLAVFLAGATALTVAIISLGYARIIQHFPLGGGGYLVATSLLGEKAGLVSGAALLVDYVLTITVSVAGGGDAVFSLLPLDWQKYKLTAEYAAIGLLTMMNLRGVKESVKALIPIFLTFIVTHVVLVVGAMIYHLADFPVVARGVGEGMSRGVAQLGLWGLFLVFLRAYSFGAGTYTGIEAVSNGLAILREPKIETGKRTMLYMAISLAMTAGGLLLCYMLAGVQHTPGRTLNAVLANDLAGGLTVGGVAIGTIFILVTIGSEAVLLFVAAETGFIDGPRVMSNMATDSWLPRRFAAMSDRLTMQNGVLLLGGAALATLAYTRGAIGLLVVMYSINVFVTFTLSQLGMLRYWLAPARRGSRRASDLGIHGAGFLLCAGILVVMLLEKFTEGGWVTVVVTSALIAVCLWVRRHYRVVSAAVQEVDRTFASLSKHLPEKASPPAFDPSKPTAVILVGGYGGLGIHILMTVLRLFPEAFHNLVFMSVGVVDAKFFAGEGHVEKTETGTRAMLDRYVDLARRMGKPAKAAFRIGTEVVDEAVTLCTELGKECSRPVFFAGTLVFSKPHWYHRLLHNETAYAIQRRLKFAGFPMVILPLLLQEAAKPRRSKPTP